MKGKSMKKVFMCVCIVFAISLTNLSGCATNGFSPKLEVGKTYTFHYVNRERFTRGEVLSQKKSLVRIQPPEDVGNVYVNLSHVIYIIEHKQ
nr:hypothetical protein 4 [Candidatus Hydrogenedentota bacterium]